LKKKLDRIVLIHAINMVVMLEKF